MPKIDYTKYTNENSERNTKYNSMAHSSKPKHREAGAKMDKLHKTKRK